MDDISGRKYLMALMHVSGYRNADIARALGYTDAWISSSLASPLMQAQIRDLQAELRERTIGDAMAMIEREAPASVRMLVEARDNGENYTVRRQSAEAILDRHPRFAKRTHHDEEHVVRVLFSTADVQQMTEAFPPRERVIDVTPAPAVAPSGIRTLDESIQAATEAVVDE